MFSENPMWVACSQSALIRALIHFFQLLRMRLLLRSVDYRWVPTQGWLMAFFKTILHNIPYLDQSQEILSEFDQNSRKVNKVDTYVENLKCKTCNKFCILSFYFVSSQTFKHFKCHPIFNYQQFQLTHLIKLFFYLYLGCFRWMVKKWSVFGEGHGNLNLLRVNWNNTTFLPFRQNVKTLSQNILPS